MNTDTEETDRPEFQTLVPLGPPFVVDSIGLEQHGTPPTLAQCEFGLKRLVKIGGAIRYWRGDLMNLTETLFHEEAAQVIDHDLMSEADAKIERLVAEKVQPTTRSHALSWDHARAVVKLPTEKQVEWLDKARAEDWSARKLASEIAAGADGKTTMRFWLVVECKTEALRNKLADRLEAEGHGVKRQEALRKVPKPKKAKNGAVTAQKKGIANRPDDEVVAGPSDAYARHAEGMK